MKLRGAPGRPARPVAEALSVRNRAGLRAVQSVLRRV